MKKWPGVGRLSLFILAALFSSALAVSGPAYSGDDCPDLLQAEKELFCRIPDAAVYSPDYCHRNVHKLLKAMVANNPDFDPRQAKVLFVMSTRTVTDLFLGRGVKAYQSRQGKVNWSGWYHAVLLYKNEIFDLDYTQTRQVVPSREYFTKMFFPPELSEKSLVKAMRRLSVRAIPGDEYLNDFEKPSANGQMFYGYTYYNSIMGEPETRYPRIPIEDFISKLP
jgi:hypothetical protein